MIARQFCALRISTCYSLSTFSTSRNNYYDLLGVKASSSANEIKKAYYSMAQKLHPDVNQSKDANEKFARINNAYQVLSDEQKKRQYDSTFSSYNNNNDEFQQSNSRQSSGPEFSSNSKQSYSFSDFFTFDEDLLKDFLNQEKKTHARNKGNKNQQQTAYSDFEDLFEEFGDDDQFGATKKQAKKPSQKRGSDLTASVQVTFEESIQGCTKTVIVEKKGTCDKCEGTKKTASSKKRVCKSCKGSGKQRVQQDIFTWELRCETCKGSGKFLDCPCKNCNQHGIATYAVKETLQIPKGVNNGQTLKFPFQGNSSERGGQAGDLIIKVRVIGDKDFTKTGNDIFSDHFITVSRAIMGGKIVVKTTKGDVEVVIPPGVQDGHKLKLQGYGISRESEKESGDQFITLSVKIPKKVSIEEKILYERLLELESQQ